MMKPKIVAVMMVKNENIWFRKALLSVRNFADHIRIIDTGSDDGTPDIAREEGAEVILQPDLTKTHQYIEEYVGTDTWVFGVDGDEIYDPAGLARLKEIIRMRTDYYEEAYQVQGHYLHATRIDGSGIVTGYPGPPSHTPTKLYNMKNITSWKQDGKHILFLCRPMVTKGVKVRALIDTWEETPLRCIHTRFLKRSTLEEIETEGCRLHGEDILGFGNRHDRGGTNKRNERLIYQKGGLVERRVDWL